MVLAKTRKHANSVVLALPSQLKVGVGEDFFVKPLENGVILLLPKLDNPYENQKEGALYDEEFSDFFALTEGEISL